MNDARNPFRDDSPNPYAAPAVALESPPVAFSHDMDPVVDQAIRTFVVLNFVWAAISSLGVLLFGAVILFGIFYSGDTGEELVTGVVGCMLFAFPFALCCSIYLAAAIGLWQRRGWGYYCHFIGAILAALSCLGLPYTYYGLTWAMTPAFRARLVR